jgi:predicted RNA polymerase sigma factor
MLEAIYAAFGIGWDDMAGIDQRGRDLAEEAIWLARVLLQLIPDQPEVRGLLALMLHCESRRAARRGPDRDYIPLSEQDTKQGSKPLITEAEQHLAMAFQCRRPGRFQLETMRRAAPLDFQELARASGVARQSFTPELKGSRSEV